MSEMLVDENGWRWMNLEGQARRKKPKVDRGGLNSGAVF